MLRRFRIALVWLIMMVVPVYGMASVGALLCAPADSSAPQAAEVHAGRAGTQAHPALHDTGDTAFADGAQGSPAAHSPSSAAAGDDAHHAGGKCSACAPCASAVAPPSAAVAMTCAAVASADFPPLRAAVDEIAIAGPERPPRAFSA